MLEPGDDEHRLAGPERPRAARLPRRRREDRAHLPGDRRRALLGARRPGPLHAPTAQIDLLGRDSVTHQLRRREDLRRGGRAGDRPAPRRLRRRGRRPPERALGQRGRRRRAARATGATPTDDDLLEECRPSTSPATSCPRQFVFVDRDRALARRARPTTAGPRSWPLSTADCTRGLPSHGRGIWSPEHHAGDRRCGGRHQPSSRSRPGFPSLSGVPPSPVLTKGQGKMSGDRTDRSTPP